MFSKMTSKRPCAETKSSSDRCSVPKGDLTSWFECHQTEKEAEMLKEKIEERKQYLVFVEQRIKDLEKDINDTDKRRYGYEVFLKVQDSEAYMQKAVRQMRRVQKNKEMMENLEKENAEMAERKEKLQRQVERCSVGKDFMDKVLQLSQFKDVDELASHLENLLQIRDKLLEKRNQVEEQTDQQRKTLQTLQEQHKLLLLQKNNQLYQLQTELDTAQAESLTWERKWEHIQDTAANKVVELGQIKMAALNLYEQTGGVVGEEGVDMNDTELQLKHIKIYMKDLTEIIKQYQISISEKNAGGGKKKTKPKQKKA